MPTTLPAFSVTEILPALEARLRRIAWSATIGAAIILAIHLLAWLPTIGALFLHMGWRTMPAAEQAAFFLASLALFSSLLCKIRSFLHPGLIPAAALFLGCLCAQCWNAHLAHIGAHPLLPYAFASAFLLLATVLLLEPAHGKPAIYLGDGLALLLCAIAINHVFFLLLARLGIFEIPPRMTVAPAPVACLFLLSVAAVLRCSSRGVFRIFLGEGLGCRTARYLCPFMLVVPLLRETVRALILGPGRTPSLGATALLASLASTIALALVLFLSWRLAAMEAQVRLLTLHDAMTDLYNLRGLTLLGEQSLQLARRAAQPFSVLYIDMDNLKYINDTYGHAIGSRLLCETADLLRSTFRETDLIARVGGDEFVVAGQFSEEALGQTVRRLGQLCTRRNREPGHIYEISFSIGQISVDSSNEETLESLLVRADRAMYEAKRQKKEALSAAAVSSLRAISPSSSSAAPRA